MLLDRRDGVIDQAFAQKNVNLGFGGDVGLVAQKIQQLRPLLRPARAGQRLHPLVGVQTGRDPKRDQTRRQRPFVLSMRGGPVA